MNELAIIFNKLDIDTGEVLAAAGSKWNFLAFRPGLVGGHCISVDPYYLTHRAQEVGYHPEVILAGRRINDRMGPYVADRVARMMMARGFPVVGSRILVLGLAFKENCPDLRNSKVVDVIATLREYNATVEVWDPQIDATEARDELNGSSFTRLRRPWPPMMPSSSRSLTGNLPVSGAQKIRAFGRPGAVFFDVKGVFAKHESDGRL